MHRSRSHFISLGLVLALAAGVASVRAQQPTRPGGPGGPQGAQGGPGGGPGGFGFGGLGARGGELSLVNDPAVQEELKLTDEQKTQLQDLAQKQRANFGGR